MNKVIKEAMNKAVSRIAKNRYLGEENFVLDSLREDLSKSPEFFKTKVIEKDPYTLVKIKYQPDFGLTFKGLGVAKRNRKDKYNQEIGINIATTRAVHDLLGI